MPNDSSNLRNIKRVVLVQPNMKWMNWNWKTSWDIHPLNLCLLGAMIKDDYEVEIVDANLENYTQEQFKKVILDLNPDLVGLTLLTNEYSEVAHIGAKLIREIDHKIITVLGGVYATVSYKAIYEDSNFDYICVGEGENSFPKLLKYLNYNKEQIIELEDTPFLPVKLFKDFDLKSVKENEVIKVLHSSGTTGSQPSKIYLDKTNANAQSKVLNIIVQTILGKERTPMLIIDKNPKNLNRKTLNARMVTIGGAAFFRACL